MVLKNKYNMLFIFECILFFVLTFFFVPTNDDLRFAYFFPFNNLSEYLHQVFYYGNGRLLGNGIIIFFSKIPWAFYPVEAVIVTAFAISIEKLTDLKNSKILAMAFVILQPVCVIKENISWMSAFINYFIPIAFFVFTMIIVKYNLLSKKKIYFLPLVIFGFCEQLFIEHNTIINILFIALILAYSIKNKMNNKKEALLLLISNIAGALVMFLYNFYIDYSKTYTASFSSPYRQTILSALSEEGLRGAVVFALKNVKYPFLLFGNSLFFVLILFALMLYIEQRAENKNVNRCFACITCISYTALFGICTYIIYVLGDYRIDENISFAFVWAVFSIVTLIEILILFYLTVLKRADKATKIKLLILVFFGLLSFAPFLLVSPCGYRCCYFMNFFFFMAIIQIINFAQKNYDFKFEKLYNILSAITIIALVIYIGLYAREKKIYNYKTEYFKTSYYLPSANENIISLGDTEKVWDDVAGFKHKYIPLNEFEKIIHNK